MPRRRFTRFTYDPVVLELLGERPDLAACLIPVFAEIRDGQRDLVKVYIGKRIYSFNACGLRFWIAISRDELAAEITGYQSL